MPINTATSTNVLLEIDSIRALVRDDLEAMQKLIKKQLSSNIPLIETIAEYIIESGGKQIRPLLTIISAKIFNYQGDAHYALSTVIEFVHTATLLHDDVIDASCLRRGKVAAHEVWGNQASVLVGDFLYSRAFQILTTYQHNDVFRVLANATNAIVEGEMDQLVNKQNAKLTEADYLKIIQHKTSSLFSAATEIGAVISLANAEEQKALATYGMAVGTAFQIIDDLLDYTASPEEMGKNIGDDLAEGKVTLPLIYALQACSTEQYQHIERMIKNCEIDQLDIIIETLKTTQALNKAYQFARQFITQAQEALQVLPNNIYRQALFHLAAFVIERRG